MTERGQRNFGAANRLSSSFYVRVLICVVAAAWLSGWMPDGADGAETEYQREVKAVLRARCFACHGSLKQESGLRLDTVASMLQGGDSGPAIVKGDPAKSLILDRVTAEDIDSRMPPGDEGEPLTRQQIAAIRKWIADGAQAPDDEQPEADPREHWAFQRIQRPETPKVAGSDWVRNPIDAFVARQHAARGLIPQPEAARGILLRRLSLDLIGLPPTPEEIAAVRNDKTPDWYEKAVKRLLEDPRYGERWGRHWMDVWRYSDWWGLGSQLRNSQKHIWRWRDWIIDSLNDDLPYDRMVRLMLAGDEIAPQDLEQLPSTGYLARNYFLFNRNQWMDETIEHVGKAFLGLTTNCAKCHDHKYDPITHTDYYRMRAIFEPYHVRLDVVPGETDLSKDGVPRVFDGVLDAPTYRYIRGDEKNPDKSKIISPGLPEALDFASIKFEPVVLPADAWQPGRRPWVVEAYLEMARKQVEAAQAKLKPAQNKVEQLRRKVAELPGKDNVAAAKEEDQKRPKPQSAVNSSSGPVINETFASLDAKRWKLFGGDWEHQPGRLEQKRDGPQRAALRLVEKPPRDFDVTVKLTYLGGSMWRSVGVAFDSTLEDPTADQAPDDTEQNVYVSAYAGEPKVQAAWSRGGKWQYPAEARKSRKVELNRQHTLRVQVRDTLINASLNGEPAIAWRTPLPRRDGSLQITTFDALVVLHEVTVSPLAADAVLRDPGESQSSPMSLKEPASLLAEAELEWKIAEQALAVAKAELHSVERRAEAQIAKDAKAESLALVASQTEREAAVAKAKRALLEAELKLLRAAEDKRGDAAKELASARESLKKAEEQLKKPSDQFTRFVGAEWTPTRFQFSGRDDPKVTFPPTSTGRRKALAEWITDRRNPLAARVAVNHIWLRHFGTPLVPTVFDFGRNGRPPTHPELLDWLASEFIENGWSMKHIHRLIVESATYRLSSSSQAESNVVKDPDNVWLWRRTPGRLESQAVRDSLLALSGTLDPTRGGPSVPRQQQEASKRRSLYFYHSNNERNLFLTMFDEALVTECYRREQSIVPQQALALTNSKLVLEASRPIADRISKYLQADGQPDDDETFIRAAFRILLAFDPSDTAQTASLQSLAAWRQLPEAGKDGAAARFARANLVWVLLNHNDFVTIR